MDSLRKIQESLDFKSVKTEPVTLREFENAGLDADVLRLDKLHPVVSGNKWFKLKYHLTEALRQKAKTLLTFGGSWSNHIVATAWACQAANLSCIGIIRGEEPQIYSDTLRTAAGLGMKLFFVTREEYQSLTDGQDLQAPAWAEELGISQKIYHVPAGGLGEAGVKGASEILDFVEKSAYTHIACSIGTATMLAGILISGNPDHIVIGVPALKGFKFFPPEIHDLLSNRKLPRWLIADKYHFGGYARKTPELFAFMNRLYKESGIKTDFVYTGKLFFACSRMASQNFFPKSSRLLIIHSGGLQGNASLSNDVLNF